LMAEPRGPRIRAGPPYQRYSAEPVPCSTQARAQRRPRGPEAAAGHPPTCGHPGRVAGHRCNWCTRTAAAVPKLRRTQLSSACRTPGTPSGPDGAWPSVFPLRWHSSSVEIASSSWPIKIRSGSRTVARLLDSVAARHSTLGGDVDGRVMEQEFYRGLAQRVRGMAEKPIRSPGVVSWISPTGMTAGDSPRHPDRPSGRCRRLARRRLQRFSLGPARHDAHTRVVLDGAAARSR
jgi:hypothetical protein